MTLVYYGIAAYVVVTLPFYHNSMNAFRAGVSTFTATLASGALILVTQRPDPVIFSAFWVFLSIGLAALGAYAVFWRYRLLKAKLASVRPRMLAELAARRSNLSGSFVAQARGSRRLMRTPSMHTASTRWKVIRNLANVLRLREHGTRMPLGGGKLGNNNAAYVSRPACGCVCAARRGRRVVRGVYACLSACAQVSVQDAAGCQADTRPHNRAPVLDERAGSRTEGARN